MNGDAECAVDRANEPWYRRVMRWGQTNIREIDALPQRYDVGWWVEHWRRTRVEGVIVNAGGIVAYYPSALELHRRSPYLGDRDLFGELTRAARENRIVVVARMDSSRANERFYYEHPDWFTVDAEGQPYLAGAFDGPFYTACISGPYYREYLPRVLQEICERYRPDGFSDNSWSGLSRDRGICYCPHCRASFAAHSGGFALPRAKNWDDRAYRAWIEWSYAQRVALWELNNAVTHRYGGPDCEWSGMNSGSLASQCRSFRDWRAMADRVRIIFLDHQGRSGNAPLWQNGEQGKLIRSLLGDDAPIPESIAFYNNSNASFRLSSKPEPEVRLWFCEAVAGGIRPWWHHVGADHEDRRMFRTAASLFTWHAANERSLRDRRHLASVAVVYSQRNVDWYGRDDPETRCDAPARGLAAALVRARIPYAMVGADRLAAQDLPQYRALLLPNVGALADDECAALRAYVATGGGLLATGETSLYDEWGDRRSDFGLADLFGAHASGQVLPAAGRDPSYLRFADPPGERPAPLRVGPTAAFTGGWDETSHLPFGGSLVLTGPAGRGERVALTLIPPFPTHPPEFAYMKVERTGLPCLYLRDSSPLSPRQRGPGGEVPSTLYPLPSGAGSGGEVGGRVAGRVAYLPADVDRVYWRLNQPDHAELLASLVRWVAHDDPSAGSGQAPSTSSGQAPSGTSGQALPVRVAGPGLVDVHAYTQPLGAPQERPAPTAQRQLASADRVIVHLVNLTHAGAWKAPVDELTTIGEQRVSLRLPPGRRAVSARLLVANQDAALEQGGGEATAIVPSIADHEVLVLELTGE